MKLPQENTQRAKVDIMMTPMIDVVFLLLIFFVCTASFQAPEDILPSPLEVGESGGPTPELESEPLLERIVVEVFQSAGQLQHRVNQRLANSLQEFRTLLEAVAAIDRQLPVVLDIGGDVALGDVIDAYDICRLVGLERIQLAAAADAK